MKQYKKNINVIPEMTHNAWHVYNNNLSNGTIKVKSRPLTKQ